MRPSGVYLSTADGSSRDSRVNSSSCERPVCFSNAARTSGPIACLSSGGETSVFGPALIQDCAASPCPFCLNLSPTSPTPPLSTPPAPPPPSIPPILPRRPPRGDACLGPDCVPLLVAP